MVDPEVIGGGVPGGVLGEGQAAVGVNAQAGLVDGGEPGGILDEENAVEIGGDVGKGEVQCMIMEM